jgi:bla regulator protein blaR1
VRRRGNFFAAVHMVVEAIFWFHPLVWWIGSRMVEERELACDEEVLRMGCEPTDYVQGILKVCRLYTGSPLPCISGVTGADIKKRLRAILAGGITHGLSGGKKVTLATIGLAALALPVLIGMLNAPAIRAQNAPATTQKFEVASIKPTGSGEGGRMRLMPGRLTASAPLRVLMEAAYHVQPFQIVGGPEWTGSEQYEIDARATGNSEYAQMMLMLQSLLADRFQLRFHREPREMPVYALVPARGGLKLPPPRDGSCVETEVQPPGQGEPAPPPRCGGLDVPLEAGGFHMRGGKVSMAEFVRKLAEMLGRTVTDQTGFSGVFDIDLVFRADGSIAGFPPLPPGAIPTETASPSIFSAVQQLGLRLESTKGPVEVLVIDNVEKPSGN